MRLPAAQVDSADDSWGTRPVPWEGTALRKCPLALEAVDEHVSEHQPSHPHPPVRLLGGSGAGGVGSWEEPSKVNGKTGGHSGRRPDRHSRPQNLGKGGEPVTSRGPFQGASLLGTGFRTSSWAMWAARPRAAGQCRAAAASTAQPTLQALKDLGIKFHIHSMGVQ